MFPDRFSKVMFGFAMLCFLTAYLFHVLLRVDTIYLKDSTMHVAWIWKATNTIAIQF